MKRTLYIALWLGLSAPSFAELGSQTQFDAQCSYTADGVKLMKYNGNLYVLGTSTRVYDSDKGRTWTGSVQYGTATDSYLCWAHSSSNSLQYWQDVYGVFSKSGTASDTLPNGTADTVTELYIAKYFYDNWNNTGGKFSYATEWYLKGNNVTPSSSYLKNLTSGGFYSNYFGNTSAFVTTYSQGMNDINGSTSTTAQYFTSLSGLKEAIISGFGYEKQSNSYIQTQEGLLPYIGIWYNFDSTNEDGTTTTKTSGHFLSCQGFTTDSNGNLKSIYITNGDVLSGKFGTTSSADIQEIFVGTIDEVVNGKSQTQIRLYSDEACSTAWMDGKDYYIGEVSYINTPEVLQNMLKEYRSIDEAAVWNGGSSEWSTQEDIVDSVIADESTGWDILVDGDNIEEDYHGYYHGYALQGRSVLFDEHADESNRSVTIVGTVAAENIEVAASGYEFLAGDGAELQAGANLTVRSVAGLHSEIALNLNDLTLETGAKLSSDKTICVSGAFSTLAATTFAARSIVTPSASVDADLDLTAATGITLKSSVDMNEHTLLLSSTTPITIYFELEGEEIPFFTNVGELQIDGQTIAEGSDLTDYLSIVSGDNNAALSNYLLLYTTGGSISLIIPEPCTATLSLMALAGLAARRRRK